MQVCEIFHSIQGESTYAGLPCIFIRLTGCNLRCAYCDTAYSYAEGKDYSVSQIMDDIATINCKLVEITGGEPLLQPEVIELMERLMDADYSILVETNGSLPIEKVPSGVHVIADVKLPSSGYADSFLPDNLRWLKRDTDELKFVMADKADFDFAVEFIHTHSLQHYTLLFSPIAGKLTPSDLADWILKLPFPVRLNLQLHKLIWNENLRGV